MRHPARTSFLITIGVLLFFVLIDILTPKYGFFGKVPTGSVGIVTRFGKVKNDALEEGFHVKGFFDKITSLSTRTQKYKVKLSAFSKDIQEVDIDLAVNFSVDKQSAAKLFKEVGTNYADILIAPAVNEETKVVFSEYNAEGLVANREVLSKSVFELLVEKLQPQGIAVQMVAIEDLDFTDAFTNAVEEKQVATQNKLTQQTKQEQLTAQAEAEANRQKIAAEAEAQVAKIQADANAYAKRISAEAEAEANRLISASITPELIDYLYANGWDGKLPVTILGDGVNVMTMLGRSDDKEP